MIIHVVPWAGSNRGGVEVSVSQLVLWQREAGLSAEILTFEDAGRHRSMDSDLLGVPVVRQRWYGFDVREKGLKGRLSIAWYHGRLRKLLRDKKCEVVHFHYLNPAYTVAGDTCAELGIPYTITFHGSDTFELECDWNWYRVLVENASDILAVSTATAEAVERTIAGRSGEAARAVTVARQGMKFRDADSSALGVRSGILFVGNLRERKNPSLFCQAMELVRKAHPTCPAIVVGTGELEKQLQDAYPWVDFRGRLSAAEVSRCMGQARALCMTSDYEGLPRVAVEAHGLGTPIVSTNVGGIAEIVADGETGFLHRDPSPSDLSASLCKLLEDDQLWQAMSQRARVSAETLHSPEQFVRAYLVPATT